MGLADAYNRDDIVDIDGASRYSPIKIIEDWGAGFKVGSALKHLYLLAHNDGQLSYRLERIEWYLRRAVEVPEMIFDSGRRRFTADEVLATWGLEGCLADIVRFVYLGNVPAAAEAVAEYQSTIGEEGRGS